MRSKVSKHASHRLQQRGIPNFIIELLHQFGSSMRSHGADRLFFDKAATKRLTHHFGGMRGLKLIERWLDVYAVLADDGTLVTVAHQTHRFRRA
jgi:hypothetical protein